MLLCPEVTQIRAFLLLALLVLSLSSVVKLSWTLVCSIEISICSSRLDMSSPLSELYLMVVMISFLQNNSAAHQFLVVCCLVFISNFESYQSIRKLFMFHPSDIFLCFILVLSKGWKLASFWHVIILPLFSSFPVQSAEAFWVFLTLHSCGILVSQASIRLVFSLLLQHMFVYGILNLPFKFRVCPLNPILTALPTCLDNASVQYMTTEILKLCCL